jgi:hypothetical protein
MQNAICTTFFLVYHQCNSIYLKDYYSGQSSDLGEEVELYLHKRRNARREMKALNGAMVVLND